MNLNPTFEEAVDFFKNNELLCEDIDVWAADRNLPMVHYVSCGLLTPKGERTPMIVELFIKVSPKTQDKHYKFTVLRRETFGQRRYYQLDVRITKKPVKDEHALPHEHFGKERLKGAEEWKSWQYSDVLAHFCEQTRIHFNPMPVDPDTFDLRGY